MATTTSIVTTSSSTSAPKKQTSKVQKQEWLVAFLFLLPSLIGLIVFFLYPCVGGFRDQFHEMGFAFDAQIRWVE